jgi:hypothetical protein
LLLLLRRVKGDQGQEGRIPNLPHLLLEVQGMFPQKDEAKKEEDDGHKEGH